MRNLKHIILTNEPILDQDGLEYDVFWRDWEEFRDSAAKFPVKVTGFVIRWDGRHEVAPFREYSVEGVVRTLLKGRDEVVFRLGWDRSNGRLRLVWDHHDASGSELTIDRLDGKAVTASDLLGQKGGE